MTRYLATGNMLFRTWCAYLRQYGCERRQLLAAVRLASASAGVGLVAGMAWPPVLCFAGLLLAGVLAGGAISGVICGLVQDYLFERRLARLPMDKRWYVLTGSTLSASTDLSSEAQQ